MFPTLKQRLDKSENTRYGPFNTHRWNRWPLCVFVCAQMIDPSLTTGLWKCRQGPGFTVQRPTPVHSLKTTEEEKKRESAFQIKKKLAEMDSLCFSFITTPPPSLSLAPNLFKMSPDIPTPLCLPALGKCGLAEIFLFK